MFLIVGLGNPGKQYVNSRHNIGFKMLDYFFDQWLKNEDFSDWCQDKKMQAEISQGRVDNEKIILCKPTTYMNNSGHSVQAVKSYYKIKPENIYIVHDDLDLKLGTYKIQFDKSSAGHNGIKSIIRQTGSQAFNRIRVGVAKQDKNKQGDTAKFVLNDFNLLERHKLKAVKKHVLEQIKQILRNK